MQEAAFGVAVKEGDDTAALLGGREGFVVAQLAREEQVGVDVLEHGAARSRADGHRLDVDVFYLARLRDRDGEAFGVADAAGDALEEMRQRLRVREGDEPAHAGGFEAADAGDGVDDAAFVAGGGAGSVRVSAG